MVVRRRIAQRLADLWKEAGFYDIEVRVWSGVCGLAAFCSDSRFAAFCSDSRFAALLRER